MAQRICEKCGASNPAESSFCHACDTYIEWHLPVEQELEQELTQVGGSDDRTVIRSPDGHGRVDAPLPQPAPDTDQRKARPPVVALDTTEVTVAPDAPGSCTMRITNASTIVESYEIHASAPPDWLVIAHDDTNLMPGELRQVAVTFSVRPGSVATAQRLHVPVLIRSSVDPTLVAEESVYVVVPPSGPPPTLLARPNLIRLADGDRGSFGLRLDNRAANFDRRYRLSATDPEGVVVCEFVPSVVDVPAGGTAEATVRFAAPAPAPGEQVSRQVTVTAGGDDGRVTTLVTLAQSTSPEPERVPARLLIEPSRITATDVQSATIEVVVDNRAGHHQADIVLHGRDPERALSFDFERTTCSVPPGRAYRVRVVVGAALPPRGETVSRPFTIVGTEDGEEITADGMLELTSRAAAISTARLRLVPEHLMVESRRGTFTVELDNRLGAEPLHVHLSGADEFGRARLAFAPLDVMVPPGGVGGSTLTVRHPRPPGGSSESRRIRVMASSGVEAIHGEAVFTQQAESRRRLWALLLVLLGAALVALGLVAYARVPGLIDNVDPAVRLIIDDIAGNSVPAENAIRIAVAVLALGFVALSVVLMLLGLNGTGRLVRTAALLAALAGVAATVSLLVAGGLGFVLVGAVLAFVGGILLKSAG